MRLNPFRSSRKKASPWLKPAVRRAVIGVILIVFSIIAVLSFFSAAGPSGNVILFSLLRLFGRLGYLVPFGLSILGWKLLRSGDERMPRSRVVGIFLLLVGLLGIFHVVGIPLEDAYQSALDGKGGGLVGFFLSFPMSRLFSSIASTLIFIAAFVVGVFLSFNLSPIDAKDWMLSLWPKKGEVEEGQEALEEDGDVQDTATGTLPLFRISRKVSSTAPADPNQLKLEAAQREKEEEQKERMRAQVKAANKKYIPPSLDILHSSISKPDSGNIEVNKLLIKTTLEKFGINVTMGKVSVGPTVAQYTLRPDEGVKIVRITALQNDLSLALAAHPIRIEAPIPNTNLVGIEIPNKDVSLVRLKDLLASKEFQKAPSPLTIVLGKDVAGKSQVGTIESMPHLLIAGATGSGKSIFINTLILSLLYRNSPALVRMILVDPKRVELSLYNGIPHLLTPVIMEPDKTINALKWAVKEMDRRYRLLAESGSRNLPSFNANNPDEAMPLIVIVIDELADLMATHSRDVEGMIVRLAQMARAIGIHLVLATQRPSVNVITGLIKANVPARIAFNVASQIDSRTILDGGGAEKLLGSGDMLYLPGDRAKPVRLQGGFISEEEVRQVVQDIQNKNQIETEFDAAITSPSSGSGRGEAGEAGDDVLFEEAKKIVIDSGKASASLLQRRLRVGYSRAARLLDMLEEYGVISPQEGNKPREIFRQSADQDGFGGVVPNFHEPSLEEEAEPRISKSQEEDPW
ncbi:MAG TPA: DNA translocase FtsK 4TM domain-containing protein [Candidatus Andersenbacteria bacterium]|nr:DNA translocase FtsK 4TM domain-containing protein [Candidatus Andersenbacteria bacterium]